MRVMVTPCHYDSFLCPVVMNVLQLVYLTSKVSTLCLRRLSYRIKRLKWCSLLRSSFAYYFSCLMMTAIF
jgi:hypothetical protein